MYPHQIRLRGPWECEVIGDKPDTKRVIMPCRWHDIGWPDKPGRVLAVRRFGYPGRIDTYERVWLTFAGLSDRADIVLNEQPLGSIQDVDGPSDFDITQLLQPRNTLEVTLDWQNETGGLWGEVAMEVRRTAYLRNVVAKVDGELIRVTGKVIGTSERPLDVYLLESRSTMMHTTVQPKKDGQTFELIGKPVQPLTSTSFPLVRVELVDGGVVWYVCEVATTS